MANVSFSEQSTAISDAIESAADAISQAVAASVQFVWTPATILTLIVASIGLILSIVNFYTEYKRRQCRFDVSVERSFVRVHEPWNEHVEILLTVMVSNRSPEPLTVTHMNLTVADHTVRNSQRVMMIVDKSAYSHVSESHGTVGGPKEPAVYTSRMPALIEGYDARYLYVAFMVLGNSSNFSEDSAELTVYTSRNRDTATIFSFHQTKCNLPQFVDIQPMDGSYTNVTGH